MTLSVWTPPTNRKPSLRYRGESGPEVIYPAVGRALSQWEHTESAFIKLFQLMCESPKLNACRAYSVIISAAGRSGAIRAAASAFFNDRDTADFVPVDHLLKAYASAAAYRNNITHGIATGCHAEPPNKQVHLGYYLMCPSYGPKRTEIPTPTVSWWLGSKYFYRENEIDHCTRRFEEIMREGMTITMELNKKYQILKPRQFHP